MQHLGLDLGATNLKWAILTRDEDEWSTVARDQVRTTIEPDVAAARYYVHDTLNKDWTNFWAPNRLCLLDMIFDSGWDAVRDQAWGKRLLVEAVVNESPTRLRKLKIAYSFAD